MTKNPNVNPNVAAVKPEVSEPVERPDGEFAYEIWVKHVGLTEVSVPWDKLTDRARTVWIAIASGCDRRTMLWVVAEQKRFYAWQKGQR